MELTSKQRAYLMSLASDKDVVIHIGKAGLTDEIVTATQEVIDKRELIKASVLKSCTDDPKEIAYALAEHTGSVAVQVIGRKIVLYKRKHKDPEIMLPEL